MIELDGAVVTAYAPGDGRRGGERIVTLLGPVTCTLTERRIAVVGANGSGKSTFARLLNGLTVPSAGHVRVDGLDTKRNGAAVRRRVGFLFTDPDAQVVMPTPVEDVALSLRRLGVPGRERDARAREALARVGLADRAEVPVRALSGGQRQLLALAAVLAIEPDVLVCDEPTTLLDLRWRHVVDTLLADLPQQVILVTHDLAAAARADRVLVIDNAQMTHDGPPTPTLSAYRALMSPPTPAPISTSPPPHDGPSTREVGGFTRGRGLQGPLSEETYDLAGSRRGQQGPGGAMGSGRGDDRSGSGGSGGGGR